MRRRRNATYWAGRAGAAEAREVKLRGRAEAAEAERDSLKARVAELSEVYREAELANVRARDERDGLLGEVTQLREALEEARTVGDLVTDALEEGRRCEWVYPEPVEQKAIIEHAEEQIDRAHKLGWGSARAALGVSRDRGPEGEQDG